MRVIIGADHGGYDQKEQLKALLTDAGYAVEDVGGFSADAPDDYPEFAEKVGHAIQADPEAKGILLCRSGEGMAMAANKLDGIRAALVWRPDIAEETRRDNDANVLVLPGDFTADSDMWNITKTFLDTPFSNEERHARRIEQMEDIEKMEDHP